MYDFTLVGCKLETIPCRPFLYYIYCQLLMSMVSRERPGKQITRSSANSALKMSLAIHEGSSLIFSPKHVTAKKHQLEQLPLGRICQRVWSQFWLWFGGPWDIPTQKQTVCLWGQSCEGLEWCHIARLFHRLLGLFQVKETNCLLPLGKVILEISFKTHQVVGCATMFSDATLASV